MRIYVNTKNAIQLVAFGFFILCCHVFGYGQANYLQSGPMVGYTTMRTATLWIQTNESVFVSYRIVSETGAPDTLLVDGGVTVAHDAFALTTDVVGLEPGIRYRYEVLFDNRPISLSYATTFETAPLWDYRTEPPKMTIALGSCNYVADTLYDRPGQPYGGEYGIFRHIHDADPDMMLWLGDNIYLREADFHSRYGYLYRYTHTRSLREMQPLMASAQNLAIWDDHDFGPNNSDRSYYHKGIAQEAFELFWANPGYGLPPNYEGIMSYHSWGDVDFFLLDNRYFRSPNNCKSCEPTMLGEQQLNWIVEALASSTAKFKIVAFGGQVLNTYKRWENYVNYPHFPERQLLLQRIAQEDVKNVVFVGGDRHHSELASYVNDTGNTVFDFTVSPLTSGAANNKDGREVNELLVPGTDVWQRNYGIIEIEGPRKERKLTFQIFDNQGKRLWTKSYMAE